MSSFVRYIDRNNEYYRLKGYEPKKWAQLEGIPFSPLKKPLAESRVVLISTSDITVRGDERVETEERAMVGGAYSISADVPVDRLYSLTQSYDRHATTLEDIGAFYPTAGLHEAVKTGRIGSLTKRFHGVYNAYSMRHTQQDVEEVLKRCREDGADVAVLVPV